MFWKLFLICSAVINAPQAFASCNGLKQCGRVKVKDTETEAEINAKVEVRIVGGEEENIDGFPWLVAFYQQPHDAFFCAGSLISERFIVSGKILKQLCRLSVLYYVTAVSFACFKLITE